jgi:addiction module HigA family antidote
MHPGQLLREEILPALNRPETQIAKLLGVSRQTLYDLLEERQPVTPIMALRLGKLCGNGPDTICSRPHGNSERRSRPFRRWRWREGDEFQ